MRNEYPVMPEYHVRKLGNMISMELAADATSGKISLLQTADQYLAWKTRVTDKCWALTGRYVAEVSDADCIAGLKAAAEVKDPAKRDCWVSKCWLIITGSLHDDLLHTARRRFRQSRAA